MPWTRVSALFAGISRYAALPMRFYDRTDVLEGRGASSPGNVERGLLRQQGDGVGLVEEGVQQLGPSRGEPLGHADMFIARLDRRVHRAGQSKPRASLVPALPPLVPLHALDQVVQVEGL